MTENWITEDMVRESVKRNAIYLTKSDACHILEQLDQQGTFATHDPRVKMEIWGGQPINGVDVAKHPNENTRKTSHQFLTGDQGLAYMVYIDGKLNGFQPHAPSIQGYHAMTSDTIQCHKGHMHSECPVCRQKHGIEQIMATQKESTVKNLAGSELMTKVLYTAQEIYDRRMEAIDKFSSL